MRIILVSLAALLLTHTLHAQLPSVENYCATDHLSQEQEAFLQSFRQNPERFSTGARSTRYIPVQIHIVGQDDGSGYYPVKEVLRNICDVNYWYKDANIHFYIKDPIKYIDRSIYFNHSGTQGASMMNIYNVPNRMNVYIVNDPAGACGYYSPFGDAIALRKSCIGPGNTTMAHEFGHYMSLPHTFNGWEGGRPQTSRIERVDGSNCQTAGDGFCDTPADYLPDRWTCPYNGPVLTDPVGDTLVPDGTQIMSYSNDACQIGFSPTQNAAMRGFIVANRSGLASQGTPATTPVAQAASLLSPTDQTQGLPANQVTLSWQQVPNASLYHVEVSRVPVFALHAYNNVVTGNTVQVNDLLPGTTYYWRVTAMNTGNICEQLVSATYSFTVTSPTGMDQPQALKGIQLYPNPVRQGQPLIIDMTAYTDLMSTIELMALDGRLLHTDEAASNQYRTIPTQALSAGFYLLRIQNSEGQVIKKIAIQ